jgi:ATP-binding cassette subfamily F protein uup
MLAGQEGADSGVISARRGLKVGYVPQSCEFPDESPENILLETLRADERPDYEKERFVQTWLSKLGFRAGAPFASRLSGGWKKRLSLAKELILEPDLLLLDEPTNHLDIEGILWLEKFLLREVPSYLIVSHDRYFLQNMINRTMEINPVYPQGLFAIDGSYSHFLEIKEQFLKGQIEQERSVASKARRELDWLRSSPKARTSKSKSRVSDAQQTLEELSQIQKRNQQKRADIDFAATERETQKLLVAKNLAKTAGDKILFRHLDLTLSPKTRIGLMGPNGSGKTTLLRILAGEVLPDQGTVKKADGLQIVYFDQHRMQLPLDMTLRGALAPDGDFVHFRGRPIHVNGWCKRFLFAPEILDMPLLKLSGGERARIAIAHLMLQPADLLLLDEPTNDLDIATLETLEESLLDFPGAVVLITHDRCMMDRVCNQLFALGDPDHNVLYADFSQWEASLKMAADTSLNPRSKASLQTSPKEISVEPQPVKVKMSYAEKKEYSQIEGKISGCEKRIQELNLQLEDPDISQNGERLQTLCTEIGLCEAQLEQLYLRWDALEKKNRED